LWIIGSQFSFVILKNVIMTLKTKNTRIAKLEISDLSFTKEGLSEYVYLNSELYLESIALANKK